MAGLDSRGLVDGFARGFGLVDAYYDKEEDRARRDKMDEENREYRQGMIERQDRNFEATEAARLQQQENWEKTHTQQQENWKKSFGLQEANINYQRGRDANQDKLQEGERQRTKDLQIIQAGWTAMLSGGDLDEETQAVFEKYPHLSPTRFIDPAVSQSIDFLSESINSGEFETDDDLLKFANNPQTLTAFNTLYATQINKGEGGQKRIVQVLPGTKDDTFVFELEVIGKDGKPYRAPMTVNRGTDKDDPVKEVSIGEISQQLAGYDQFNSLVKIPEVRNKLERFAVGSGMAGSKDTDNWTRLSDNAVLNKKDGTVKQVPGGASTKPTSSQLKYKEMLDLGVPENIARGVSYGTFKTISDPNSGGTIMVDVATGQPIGGFVPVNPDEPFGEMRWQSMNPQGNGGAGGAGDQSREADINAVLQANPSYSRDKAIAYLKHINRW